jgi:hypothetical protein
MQYSFYVGILPNFDLSISGWIFAVIAMLLLLVGGASLLYSYSRSQKLPIKIGYFIAFSLSGLIFFGIAGVIFFALAYFASYAFITDFTKDY